MTFAKANPAGDRSIRDDLARIRRFPRAGEHLESVTMSSEVADRDGAIVVAPQQRSVPMRKYLTMATTLDPGLAAIQEPDVDRLLELARGRIGAVTLSARSALHFEGLRCLAESVRRDPYYDELGKRSATAFMYNWICKYIRFERDLVEFADIAHVPVQKPMLIVGFGSTCSPLCRIQQSG